MMPDVLYQQLDYIQFFYGFAYALAAFFAFTAGGEKYKGRPPWTVFGLFAAFHGAHEWAGILKYTLGEPAWLSYVDTALLALSFVFLFEFGRAGYVRAKGVGPGRWVFIPLFALVVLGATRGMDGAAASSRYALGLTGGLVSAYALILASKDDPSGGKDLRLMAAALAVYALLTGLVPAPAPFFPADRLNTETFITSVGLPAQLFRGLVALYMTAMLSRHTKAFLVLDLPVGRRARASAKDRSFIPAVMVLAIIVAGWVLTEAAGWYGDDLTRTNLLYRSRTAAAAINPDRVAGLTGEAESQLTPDYRRLKEQLADIQRVNEDCRSICVERVLGGKFVCLVGIFAPCDGDLKACEVFTHADAVDLVDYAMGKPMAYGPAPDHSGGRWLTCVAPIYDRKTGVVIARLRMDLDASGLMRSVGADRLSVILITLVLCLMTLAFFFAWVRTRENSAHAAALKLAEVRLENEKKLRELTSSLGEGILVKDAEGKLTFMNPEAERLLGWSEAELVGRYVHDAIHYQNADGSPKRREDCLSNKTLKTGETYRDDSDVFTRKDGKAFPMSYVTSPIMDEGNVAGAVTVFQDITERRKAEEGLTKTNALLDSLSRLQSRFIEGPEPKAVFNEMLEALLWLTDSEYGLIGEVIHPDEAAPYLKVHALTDIAWDEPTRLLYERFASEGMELRNLGTLFGEVIRTGRPVVSDHPATDPRSGGLPEGHPQLKAFMGLPFYKGGTLVGMVCVANRPGGYDDALVEYLSPFLATCAGIVEAYRNDQRRRLAEESLAERARITALGATVGSSLTQGQNLRCILQGCAEGLVKHLDAALARIWITGDDPAELRLMASAGMYSHIDGPHGVMKVGEGKIGWIAAERQPHMTNSVVGDPLVHDQDWAVREGIVSFAGYPLIVEDRVSGVMAMFARKPLTEATMAALASVADEVAIGVERKKADLALRESEARLGGGEFVGRFGSWEWRVGTDRVIWSDGLCRIFGVDPADFGGRYRSFLEFVHKDDMERVMRLVGESVSEARPLSYEARIIRADGAERVIDVHGEVEPGEDGKPARLMGTVQDITERKRAEEELGRFKFILDKAREEFYLNLPDGRLVYVNKAAADSLGYTIEELLRLKVMDIDPHFDEESFRKHFEELKLHDMPPVETTHMTKTGALIAKEIKPTYLKMDDNEYVCAFGRDITERKGLERQRSDFYAMVSHDLKSPLAAIMGYSDLMITEDMAKKEPDTFEMAQGIRQSGDKILRMVDDFLTISRMEAGNVKLSLAKEDMDELLLELLVEASSLTQKGGQKLIKEVEEGLPNMVLSRIHVTRAVSNLVQNAVNYTPAGGTITVKAFRTGDAGRNCVVISVKDDGPGIPREEQSKVFEKYYRSPRVAGSKGSGLGLAIVKVVAEAHGGRVELLSDVGRGSEFRLILPEVQ